jgi:YVTN family beta-propeller protein
VKIAPYLLACLAVSGQAPVPRYTQTVTQNGTRIALSVEHVDPAKTASDPLLEYENVAIEVRFSDTASGFPIAGGGPAAWMDRKPSQEKTTQAQCVGKVQRFAEGSTFSHTTLDLTSYFVVTMNSDATLTVVDPRFGYGDTRLLAMVSLDGPGEDWANTGDGRRIFVSVPSANQVVAIDTASWKAVATAASVPHASRVALQPDEAYLWAAYGAETDDSGVVVLNARDLKVAARISTGRGYHHIAFTEDSSVAFVTNPKDGTVSVIDVRKLALASNVPVGAWPKWIAYSDLAKAVYITNEGDGKIVAIDAAEHKIIATMAATPGLGQIRFAPGGRFAVTVNPKDDMLYVVDAASNQIVQRRKLEGGPDQIAFTNKTVHIRQTGSDNVLMIALASLGQQDTEISVADFPGGRHAPGETSHPTPADGIVQASGENAVLIANPGDKSVYFYMEGSAAPTGNLGNYGREPRAVLSMDRNLRERSPGVYRTTATLPAAGSYDLALFLDRPRIVSCFDLAIASDPSRSPATPPKVKIESRTVASAAAGQPAHLAFRIAREETGKPETEAKDVVILMMGPGWQSRQIAPHRGDGVYAVDFAVPTPGVYTVFLGCPSLGLSYLPYATVTVTRKVI